MSIDSVAIKKAVRAVDAIIVDLNGRRAGWASSVDEEIAIRRQWRDVIAAQIKEAVKELVAK